MHFRRHYSSQLWITFNLTCSPQYTKWFEQSRHNWSHIIAKFDMDLVPSPRTSQSSQFSNSMPSPTTHATSYDVSQLEQPCCFSNPSQLDRNNLSLRLVTDSLLILTRISSSPSPLSLASSTPHRPLFTFSINPYQCPTLMTLVTFWSLYQSKSCK